MPSRIEIIEQNSLKASAEALIIANTPEFMPESPFLDELYREAGPKLAQESRQLAPCPYGEARITRGHQIPFSYIIHTIPPIWGGGESGEDVQLAACYQNALHLAASYQVKTLAISPLYELTGYPATRAAHIAMRELLTFLRGEVTLNRLLLCCPGPDLAEDYESAFDHCTA